MADKEFFKTLTKQQIKKKELIICGQLFDVLKLNHSQFTIFESFVPKGYSSARKFMKHAPEVKPKRFTI